MTTLIVHLLDFLTDTKNGMRISFVRGQIYSSGVNFNLVGVNSFLLGVKTI